MSQQIESSRKAAKFELDSVLSSRLFLCVFAALREKSFTGDVHPRLLEEGIRLNSLLLRSRGIECVSDCHSDLILYHSSHLIDQSKLTT
jgi:hypothetical protein